MPSMAARRARPDTSLAEMTHYLRVAQRVFTCHRSCDKSCCRKTEIRQKPPGILGRTVLDKMITQ